MAITCCLRVLGYFIDFSHYLNLGKRTGVLMRGMGLEVSRDASWRLGLPSIPQPHQRRSDKAGRLWNGPGANALQAPPVTP